MGEVSELLEETINRVRQGPFDLRAANAIGFLAGILLKALDHRVEERLAHLEAVFGRTRTETEALTSGQRSRLMKSHRQRVRVIELSLTPQQVVMVWLRNALLAGTLEEGARHLPPHRSAVANAVYHNVRNSMRGQDDSLIERAIVQSRQEADLLYMLAINANLDVIRTRVQREREYVLLLGYLGAEMRGNPTLDAVQDLRMAVLMVIESVMILDAGISRVSAEHLNGEPVLFGDAAAKLAEQLQMTTNLSKCFNELAVEVGAAEIDLEEVRGSLGTETDRQVSSWVHLARADALSLFGTV
jgi:hypothetical protein